MNGPPAFGDIQCWVQLDGTTRITVSAIGFVIFSESPVWRLLLIRFSSPFHENFVVTQHTSAGVFHHSKNSQGTDPRNEHSAFLKGAFSNWFLRGNQLKTLTELFLCSPGVFFLGLPLRFASACSFVGVLGGLGCVCPVSVPLVVLSFVACPLLLSGCVSPCGRRPEDQLSL